MSHFGRAGPPDIRDTYSLLVLNITFRTSADDLFPLFDRYGKVVDIFIPRDRRCMTEFSHHPRNSDRNPGRRTGESRGFAFVRYKYADEAQKAIERLDGRNVDGREIAVQYAKYGPNAEAISRGRISQGSPRWKSRSRSRSPGRPSRGRFRDGHPDRGDYQRSRGYDDRYERERHREPERERERSHHRNHRHRRASPSPSVSRSRSHSRSRGRANPVDTHRSNSRSVGVKESPRARSVSRGRSPSGSRHSSRARSVSSSPHRSGEIAKEPVRNGSPGKQRRRSSIPDSRPVSAERHASPDAPSRGRASGSPSARDASPFRRSASPVDRSSTPDRVEQEPMDDEPIHSDVGAESPGSQKSDPEN